MLTILAAALAAFFVSAPSAAIEQGIRCLPVQVVTAVMEREGRIPAFMGLADGGALLWIWIDPETDHWLAYVQNGAGIACRVAEGTAGHVVALGIGDSA